MTLTAMLTTELGGILEGFVLGSFRYSFLGDLGGSWRDLRRVFFGGLLVGGLQFFSWAVRAGLRALLVVYCLSLHVLRHHSCP